MGYLVGGEIKFKEASLNEGEKVELEIKSPIFRLGGGGTKK